MVSFLTLQITKSNWIRAASTLARGSILVGYYGSRNT